VVLRPAGDASARPVTVVLEHHFRATAILYRPGMGDDQALFLGPDDFPISPLRSSVLTAAAPISRLASSLRFRHALANEFSGSLRKCAGKQGSISFEMRASPADTACLFGWPGGPTASLKVSSTAGAHRISYLITEDQILKPCSKKETLLRIPPSSPRSSWDLLTHTLAVKAKVGKVTRGEALRTTSGANKKKPELHQLALTHGWLASDAMVDPTLKLYSLSSTTSPIASANMSPRLATPRIIMARPMLPPYAVL
ncbi:hypothetical protein B484DRAFT_399488, partial [Ochromonadaceae sp. CCMP2298]